eukprot:CAMPEP_0175626316 /NCGR_PEP_ID=MMETSP0096-20121207/70921_1 /TAXON_ID=311494 /ORGANISM="Alexandrium monilatum, Strain CCMP3105" /LENGTH=39 /DNA_ID= /DNA_START= /DNA_END= /DNA_ORIENTATION=
MTELYYTGRIRQSPISLLHGLERNDYEGWSTLQDASNKT